jgi:hypothetical protein
MNKAILALAAVLAVSGSAFAGTCKTDRQAAACIDGRTNVKLDCTATGSIENKGSATRDNSADSQGPRLGIGNNPWTGPVIY